MMRSPQVLSTPVPSSHIEVQEMDLAAAKAGLDVDPPPHMDGVIETVVGANGAAAEAPVEELSEEEILANQRLEPGAEHRGPSPYVCWTIFHYPAALLIVCCIWRVAKQNRM